MSPQGIILPPPGVPAEPARRRLLALGLLLAALALLGLGVLAPLAERFGGDDLADRQRELLARAERVVAQMPALRRELETLDAELAAPGSILRAPTLAQAGAALQASLRAVLDAEGVTPESTQALAVVPHGPFQRVALRVELRMEHEALARVLAAIEAHRPHLLVREALVVAPREAPREGGGPSARLAVRLEVAALAEVPQNARRG
jgi:hypothetical protein